MDNEEKQCRTCLIKNGEFLKINISIAEMIGDITSLLISPNDKLSQWVCIKCEEEIKRSHEFRKQCLEAAKILSETNNYIDNIKIEIKDEPQIPGYDEIDIEENWNPIKIEPENSERIENPETIPEIPEDYFLKIIFDCPFCHGPFYDSNVFDKHLRLFHPDKNEDVQTLIQSRYPLGFICKSKDKIKKKGKSLEYKCACSNFTAPEYPAILEHFKEHFGRKHIICTLCDYRCDDINLLKGHILIHKSEKPFACLSCNYTCKNKKALRIHSAKHSTEKKYQCKHCPLTFKRASALSRHKTKVHDKKMNFACHLCDEKFFQSECLKQHMIIHTGITSYTCNLCGQDFAQESSLKIHMSVKHEDGDKEMKFKCDLCSYATMQKGHLKMHMKRHNGEKNFICDHCPFSTVSKYALTLHIMRHFGQKRFSCDMCDYKGMTVSEIKQHKLNHTGERPFACTFCSYSGKYSRDLKKHMLMHEPHQNVAQYILPIEYLPEENEN